MAVAVGDRAPDFSLPSGTGTTIHLQDYIGKKPVVLYFYPKSDTPGCTVQACSFRDAYTVFQELGAEVIGLSNDSVAAQDRFAKNHQLPFILLSDEGNQVRKLYGVPGPIFGMVPGRVTYIIDQEGIVRHIFDSMLNFSAHVDESLKILRQLQD
ncbi:peroxiredoxin [Candidatus Synechococcus calcipolaris G9]|uniref:thioredoxin-dependent peroxiredoxin n=1 Tax=Candidatus Synechococcus calcipolaris G9 TaxID=1497997 RepID=A0ABT6EVH4_9SYNE|nr:peroxiredoxin [Candidatus Synechococcus calcipolaris]MDG2989802.1 peroxiredoxin [Candidatus Synechococcus calcipolaris G9]